MSNDIKDMVVELIELEAFKTRVINSLEHSMSYWYRIYVSDSPEYRTDRRSAQSHIVELVSMYFTAGCINVDQYVSLIETI